MRVMVVSAAIILALVLAGWLIFLIPEWTQRARVNSRIREAADIDPRLATIDVQHFQARHHVIEAKAQRRRMEALLRETKKTERDRTKRFEIEQREAERAQRRQMQKDEYRRAAARRRGRLAASIVMVLGIVSAILGGTTFRTLSASLWLITGGIVFAIIGVWMLSRLEQVAQARRAAIARGEGVFVDGAGVTRSASVDVNNVDAAHDSVVNDSTAEVEREDEALLAQEVAQRQAARAENRTWQPTALPAPLGKLTHETARQAAFAEGQRLSEAARVASTETVESAHTADTAVQPVESAADITTDDDSNVEHDETRAELAAASEASLEALRRAQDEPEIAELSSVRPEELPTEEAAPLRGESLDAILRQRRQG